MEIEKSENKKSEKNKLIFFVSIAILILGFVGFLKYTGLGAEFVWKISENGTLFFPLVTIASLVDSINPCAFSILLLTIAFLFSIGKLRAKILKIGGVYILGIFVVYIMIGLGILQTLHFFNTPHFMAKVGAALLLLLGLISIINEFFPSFPIKLRIPHNAHRTMATLMEKGSLPTAFLLGVFVGLCEFPCTGGPYLLVLGLLHDHATFWNGLAYLVWYNIVFILPLVVILFAVSNKILLDKIQTWRKTNIRSMRLYGGIAMVILGILIFLI